MYKDGCMVVPFCNICSSLLCRVYYNHILSRPFLPLKVLVLTATLETSCPHISSHSYLDSELGCFQWAWSTTQPDRWHAVYARAGHPENIGYQKGLLHGILSRIFGKYFMASNYKHTVFPVLLTIMF